MSLVKEFQEFAVKGNAMDMAVGIIIGAAFGKIVTALVNDVIMPPVGLLLGGTDFSNLKVVLKAARLDPATGKEIAAVSLNYGSFINTVLDFLIVALAIFFMIKLLNRIRRLGESKPKT
jgi:large conductance mechanosensitive channel